MHVGDPAHTVVAEVKGAWGVCDGCRREEALRGKWPPHCRNRFRKQKAWSVCGSNQNLGSFLSNTIWGQSASPCSEHLELRLLSPFIVKCLGNMSFHLLPNKTKTKTTHVLSYSFPRRTDVNKTKTQTKQTKPPGLKCWTTCVCDNVKTWGQDLSSGLLLKPLSQSSVSLSMLHLSGDAP